MRSIDRLREPDGRPRWDRRVRAVLDRMSDADRVGQITSMMLPSAGEDLPADEPLPGVVYVRDPAAADVADRVRRYQELAARTGSGVPGLVVAAGGAETAPATLPALARAATWDLPLVRRLAAREARALRAAGILGLLVDGGPDPGQPAAPLRADPVLGAATAAMHVRGAQGRESGRTGRITVDHVACSAGPLGVDRDAHWHERILRSTHLVAAEAAVRAGAMIAVPAHASNADVPGHTDSWQLRDVLRHEWGFGGVVLALPGALGALVDHYEVAERHDDAVAMAVEAGIDVLEPRQDLGPRLLALLERGTVPRWLVDEAAAAVLQVKLRLGLLDDPATAQWPVPARNGHRSDDDTVVSEAVTRSVVRLSDPAGALPLGSSEIEVVIDGEQPAYSGMLLAAGHQLAGALARRLPEARVATTAVPSADAGVDVVLLTTDPAAATSGAARVVGAGGRCVVLVCSDRLHRLDELLTTTASVLLCWTPPVRHADAVAEILLGSAEPGGRLPVRLATAAGRPSVPLGCGVGYTTYRYTSLRISPEVVTGREHVSVRCWVANLGPRAGREVVQVYLSRRTGSTSPPDQTLAGFAAVDLAAGQSLSVTVRIPPERLAEWNRSMKLALEPGIVDVLVGRSATDIRLRGELPISSVDEL